MHLWDKLRDILIVTLTLMFDGVFWLVHVSLVVYLSTIELWISEWKKFPKCDRHISTLKKNNYIYIDMHRNHCELFFYDFEEELEVPGFLLQ